MVNKMKYKYYKWSATRNNYFNLAYFIEKLKKIVGINNIKRVSLKNKYYTRIKYKSILQRTRQQVVYNASYGNSLRAIGFNEKYAEDELEAEILGFLKSNPMLIHFGFISAGYENEEIDDSEDKGLNENKINLQLNDNDINYMELNRK